MLLFLFLLITLTNILKTKIVQSFIPPTKKKVRTDSLWVKLAQSKDRFPLSQSGSNTGQIPFESNWLKHRTDSLWVELAQTQDRFPLSQTGSNRGQIPIKSTWLNHRADRSPLSQTGSNTGQIPIESNWLNHRTNPLWVKLAETQDRFPLNQTGSNAQLFFYWQLHEYDIDLTV